MTSGDTIVAPATPYGFSGLAIIRLSGNQALNITKKQTHRSSDKLLFKHRSAILCSIYSTGGDPFDDVMVTYFKAPNSYTGEDVVEISCHGNPTIVEEAIFTACHYGARVAEPGEFTRRAFINGKLDLLQAEAIADMINTQSVEGAKLSYRNLQGSLSSQINLIREILIKTLGLVEFELDISEDESHSSTIISVREEIQRLTTLINQLLESYLQGKLFTRGATVVITGKSNVGKSTLLNALSNTERAITSHIPGTTRDVIDVTILVRGLPIRLVDTAGLRTTNEPIETEGVKRAHQYIKTADLIISVSDNPSDLNTPLPSFSAPVIKILNKIDLPDVWSSSPHILSVSAKTGQGLNDLINCIIETLGLTKAETPSVLLTTTRQRNILTKARDSLSRGLTLANENDPSFELVSFELRSALDFVDRILGKTTSEEILNNIFNRFCVGK